jgi:hypothetical protein
VGHPADRVVLFEDKHAPAAELCDGAGSRKTTHARSDHDDVGFLSVSHVGNGAEADLTATE